MSETMKDYEQELEASFKKVEEGDILKIDKFVKFEIFSPGEELTDDINDNSIVMKLKYNNFSCLFTGDISQKIEKYFVKQHGRMLESTVLKVAHHRFKNVISRRIYR